MLKRSAGIRVLLLITAALLVHLSISTGQVSARDCIPNGGIDDTLDRTDCCSGYAQPGSTFCVIASDWGTTWESCYQYCAAPPGCDQFNHESCYYSLDPVSGCCVAPPPSPGYFCPDACV